MLSRNVKKYHKFLSENFHFLVVKFSVYLNRHVFVMYLKTGSLCHQHGDMHIDSTVTFVRIYGKITILRAPNMFILVLSFTKNANSVVHILVIVDTSTNYALSICVIEYQQ